MKEELKNKILWIDKEGWPLESIKGRRIVSIIRKILYVRSFERYEDFYNRTGVVIRFD